MRGQGAVEGYEWWHSPERQLWQLRHLVTRHFGGRFLLIACFDSGRISPGEDETKLGWRPLGEGMLSPPLTENLHLPSDQFDEWWIFEDVRAVERFPAYDCFVNYTAWTLRTPAQIDSSYDPTSDRSKSAWAWLTSMQERFWKMVREYRPLAYLADGGQLTIASRELMFIEALSR